MEHYPSMRPAHARWKLRCRVKEAAFTKPEEYRLVGCGQKSGTENKRVPESGIHAGKDKIC